MSVNMTVQSGVVRSPALRYDSQSRAEFRFTLDQTEGDWHLYLPCFSPGAAGERLASELDDGMSIVITSGKLAYRNRTTKLGEQSRMEILVWAVDRLTESPQDARAEASEGDPRLLSRSSRLKARARRPCPKRASGAIPSGHPRRRVRIDRRERRATMLNEPDTFAWHCPACRNWTVRAVVWRDAWDPPMLAMKLEATWAMQRLLGHPTRWPWYGRGPVKGEK